MGPPSKSSLVSIRTVNTWERGRPARTGLDQGSGKVPLNKGGQRFRRNRAGVVVPPLHEARTTPKACGLCPLC